MLFVVDFLLNLFAPCVAILRLNVSEHSGVAFSGGIRCCDELSEAVFSEIVRRSGFFVQAFGFETEPGTWTTAARGQFDVNSSSVFPIAALVMDRRVVVNLVVGDPNGSFGIVHVFFDLFTDLP